VQLRLLFAQPLGTTFYNRLNLLEALEAHKHPL
jgi:hypothetical protein